MLKIASIYLISLIALLGCNTNKNNSDNNTTSQSIPLLGYEYLKSYPHDEWNTEGLLIHDGKLFESTGATNELSQTRSVFGWLT